MAKGKSGLENAFSLQELMQCAARSLMGYALEQLNANLIASICWILIGCLVVSKVRLFASCAKSLIDTFIVFTVLVATCAGIGAGLTLSFLWITSGKGAAVLLDKNVNGYVGYGAFIGGVATVVIKPCLENHAPWIPNFIAKVFIFLWLFSLSEEPFVDVLEFVSGVKPARTPLDFILNVADRVLGVTNSVLGVIPCLGVIMQIHIPAIVGQLVDLLGYTTALLSAHLFFIFLSMAAAIVVMILGLAIFVCRSEVDFLVTIIVAGLGFDMVLTGIGTMPYIAFDYDAIPSMVLVALLAVYVYIFLRDSDNQQYARFRDVPAA